MKNKKFELYCKLQKQYVKNTRPQLEKGIVVRHLYDPNDTERLSWWDDTGFILNGKKISIWWTHPRNEFKDDVDSIAHENVPSGTDIDKWLDDCTTNYTKVGKSRKKIVSYTTNDRSDNEVDGVSWIERLKAEQVRIAIEHPITIKPHYKVESLAWCRAVSICVPIEVRGVNDLHILCTLVKALLKQQTTLENEFGDYNYTNAEWAKENPDAHPLLISHAVKL